MMMTMVAVGFGVYEQKQCTEAETRATLAREDLASLETQLNAVRRSGAKSEQRAVRAEEQLTALEAKVRGLFPSIPIAAAPSGSGGANFQVSSGPGGFSASRPPPRPEPNRQEIRNSIRVATNTSYMPFYRRVGFTSEQRDRFNELVLDVNDRKENSLKDAIAAARYNGREAMQAAVEQVNAHAEREMLAAVKSGFGDSVAEAYQGFQETVPVRGVISQLANALFYTESPLTANQAELLVEILGKNARTAASKVEVAAINKTGTLAAAQTVLTPSQLEALAVQIDQALRRAAGAR